MIDSSMMEFDKKGNYVPQRDKMGDAVVDPAIFVAEEPIALDYTVYEKNVVFGCKNPRKFYFD